MLNKVKIKVIFVILLLWLSPMASADCVILLHGLARTESSMKKLAKHLESHGFATHNISYNSRKGYIEDLSKTAIKPALTQCAAQPVHFVTHSMGGILVRHYLSENTIPNLKRVVMLGPPNQGSEVVNKLGAMPGFKLINGHAGLQLKTGKKGITYTLGKANFELGIIAGKRSMNPFLSLLIPGKDDGKVSVKSTKLDGMKDHIIMPVTHTFMMRNKKVMKQVVFFLQNGKFNH